MSTLNVNSIAPESGTTITIGGSGDTVTLSQASVDTIIPQSGSTITIGGSGDTVNLGSGASSSGFGVAVAGIVGVSTFTSSGTWTKATRETALGVTIKRVIVEVQGGGGGGCTAANSAPGSSGAAGGYSMKVIDTTSISSASVTVGVGGSQGSTAGAGGTSSWSDGTNTLTCTGGAGGYRNGSRARTNGGTASGGDLNYNGAHGGGYFAAGGCSKFGSGGSAGASGSTGAGAFGAGGQGSNATNGDSGGPGGKGIVIVTEIAG